MESQEYIMTFDEASLTFSYIPGQSFCYIKITEIDEDDFISAAYMSVNELEQLVFLLQESLKKIKSYQTN